MADFVKGARITPLHTPVILSDELQKNQKLLETYLDRTAYLGKQSADTRRLNMDQGSHSVDIALGYDELTRARLIGFLRKIKTAFQAPSVERGVYQHENMLRVYTKRGYELVQYLREHFPGGNDFRFVVHESEAATKGYKKFKPDTETKLCRMKFDL